MADEAVRPTKRTYSERPTSVVVGSPAFARRYEHRDLMRVILGWTDRRVTQPKEPQA